MVRDSRLDLWRGLCLIDVVLVHLAYNGVGFPAPLEALVKDYTRFAAGGFVLLAGMTVGAVFGPRVDASGSGRREVYWRLLLRGATLVAVGVAVEFAHRLLDPLRGFPFDPDTDLRSALVRIAFLQEPSVLGGILLLYTVLLVVTPVLFEIRRRFGSVALVATSVLVYVAAIHGGDLLVWPRNEFPVPYWQPLYVFGFAASRLPGWIDEGGQTRARGWLGVSLLAFAAVFTIEHGERFGLPDFARALSLDFSKTPLMPGALIWYLAGVSLVLAASSLAWTRFLRGTRAERWLGLLGRNSLLVYAAHVFTEVVVLEVVWRWWPPAAMRIALVVADVAALSLLCLVAERLQKRPARAITATWPRVSRGLAVASIAFAVTVSGTRPEPPIGGIAAAPDESFLQQVADSNLDLGEYTPADDLPMEETTLPIETGFSSEDAPTADPV